MRPVDGKVGAMPEPGELITVTRVVGIDSIIQQIGGLYGAFGQLQQEVRTRMTSLEGQLQQQADTIQAGLDNVSADLQGLKDDLAAVNTDVQGQVEAGVAQRLQAVVDRFGPIADQVTALAASTPDKEPPAEPEQPADPGQPAEPDQPAEPEQPQV